MTRCPSDLALEAHLLAPATSPVRGHVGACAACQARLRAMRQLGEEFERDVLPATIARVASTPVRVPAPPRRIRRWVLVAAPLAAAALVLFVVLRDTRGGLALTVLVEEAGRVEPVRDGSTVPAGAALRFRVQPDSPCNLWVLSVHPSGDVVRLYPPKGDPVVERRLHPVAQDEVPAIAPLGGGAGPERIFAVCTPQPVPWNTVKTAAAEKLGKGAEAVRSYRSISGLPRGTSQTTLLVEKRT